MTASLSTPSIALTPGQPSKVTVMVTNRLSVIDGVRASVRPTPGLKATVDQELLALFPDTTGHLNLELCADRQLPAGRHFVVVEVTSAVTAGEICQLQLEVEVAAVPSATLTVTPPVRRRRRLGRYEVAATNDGNVTVELDLTATDPEHALAARWGASALKVAPGQEVSTSLTLHGRLRLLGNELRRQVSVAGLVTPVGVEWTQPPAEVSAQVSLRQCPLLPRGARTAALLAAVVLVWAAIFIAALAHAFGNDPLTKTVPASFYAADQAAAHSLTAVYGPAYSASILDAAAASGQPAGALPKSGPVIGVGGTITGTVTAASSGAGVGRILVQAVRSSPHGPVVVSSAATSSGGTYSLPGLLPGNYEVEFSSAGFSDVWYPAGPTAAGASPVTVNAGATTPRIDAVVRGLPGSITGIVDSGQTPSAPVTVTVVGEQGPTGVVAVTTTNSSGDYTIPNLPTPGTYDLSFTATGYQVGSDTEVLAGGQADIANTVVMSAGAGTISGTVLGTNGPVGGVTISASANGTSITSATPTTGAVGQFTIPNLVTPATYLLTFTKAGYSTDTVAEHLGPGQSLGGISVRLGGGAGEVSGLVTDGAGEPLGGITVTVDGGASSATTQTLTAGSVGSFLLSGLTTPGHYALSFSGAGWGTVTVPVDLPSDRSVQLPTVRLSATAGTVIGTVTAAGAPMAGVTVTATDGSTVETTTTASAPGGSYTITGLTPGAWTVTFSLTGYTSVTELVQVAAGAIVAVSPALAGPG